MIVSKQKESSWEDKLIEQVSSDLKNIENPIGGSEYQLINKLPKELKGVQL